MDGHVFGRDREAEAGAAGRACARSIRPEEAVEHVVCDLLGHSHSAIAYSAGNVAPGRRECNRDGGAVSMFDRIDDKVADDALDAAFVDLGGHAYGGDDFDADSLALCEIPTPLDDAADDGSQVAVLCVEQRARSVVARDLEQVCEHLFHALGLIVQQLGGAACVGG